MYIYIYTHTYMHMCTGRLKATSIARRRLGRARGPPTSGDGKGVRASRLANPLLIWLLLLCVCLFVCLCLLFVVRCLLFEAGLPRLRPAFG